MNKILITIATVLITISCNENHIVLEGDLYFPLLGKHSFYKADQKTIDQFEKKLDSIRWSKIASNDELEIIRVFDILKKNDLLKSPWINLKIDGDIKTIYLTESEFKKLKKFKRHQLVQDKQKVYVKVRVRKLDREIYFSEEILEIQVVKGKTYWRK